MSNERFRLDESPPGSPSSITLEHLARLALRRWRFVLVFSLACAFLTAGVSLLVPNEYTATATTLPTSNSAGYGGLMALADRMPGLDMTGLGMSGNSGSMLYPEILKSRQTARAVLGKTYAYRDGDRQVSCNLYEYFDQDNPDLAYEILQQQTSISYDKKTGVVSVAVTTENPELAAQVANSFVHRLDEFNRNERKTSAGQNRQFIENRIAETSQELVVAEEALRQFRRNNRNYMNSTSPDLQLEHARLMREVEMKNEVYLTLAGQRELAAIQEKKETPVIQLLDTAKPPTVKSGPHRAKITIFGMFVGLVLAVGLVGYTHTRQGLDNYRRLTRAAGKLHLVRRNTQEKTVEHV